MRRSSRNKRPSTVRGSEKIAFTLMVHGIEYGTGEELVINPDCFPDIKVNDLLEITQPDREHERLILQVGSLAPVRGKLQISILKDLAAQFNLDAFHDVLVQKVDSREATVDFVELTFKDQFLSRAEIWRYKVAMYGKCVYLGKTLELLGIRSQVESLLQSNQPVLCGVVGADTKMIVRSRSSRLFWLIQMSTEMWEFAPDGELYYEKLINRLIKVLISKWNDCGVSHSLTIIAFSRSFYDKDQFPSDYNPNDPLFAEPIRQGYGPGCTTSKMAEGYGPNVHVDAQGRYYEDFYKVLVLNFCGPDWNQLLSILKNEFVQYPKTHRWRLPEDFLPVEYDVRTVHSKCESIPVMTSSNDANSSSGSLSVPPTSYVEWRKLPFGVPSRAADGNILEAINVTLNILDKHYMDRDLNRTGQSILMITAGCGIFHVEQRLAQITKQRMMDNGVGMDMLSLTTPPLHVVPLFIWQKPRSQRNSNFVENIGGEGSGSREPTPPLVPDSSPASIKSLDLAFRNSISHDDSVKSYPKGTGWSGNASSDTFYNIPHWVNITFLDFDCHCQDQQSISSLRASGHGSGRGSSTSGSSNQNTGKGLSSSSIALGGGGALWTKNGLSRAICECQMIQNERFHPLPAFRMFDLTAPSGKLSFPMSLRNLMLTQIQPRQLSGKSVLSPNCAVEQVVQESPENNASGDRVVKDNSSDEETKMVKDLGRSISSQSGNLSRARVNGRRRKMSDMSSDTLSSSQVPAEQWHLSKSPDYDVTLLRGCRRAAGSGVGGASTASTGGTGVISNSGAPPPFLLDSRPTKPYSFSLDALMEYDAAVFSPGLTPSTAQLVHAPSSGSFGTTSGFTGIPTVPLAERSVRGIKKSGLTSTTNSLLSPRSEAMLKESQLVGTAPPSPHSATFHPSRSSFADSSSAEVPTASQVSNNKHHVDRDQTETDGSSGVVGSKHRDEPFDALGTSKGLRKPIISPAKPIPTARPVISGGSGDFLMSRPAAVSRTRRQRATIHCESALEGSNVSTDSAGQSVLLGSGAQGHEGRRTLSSQLQGSSTQMQTSEKILVSKTPPARFVEKPSSCSPLSLDVNGTQASRPVSGSLCTNVGGMALMRRDVSGSSTPPMISNTGATPTTGTSAGAPTSWFSGTTINPFRYPSDTEGISQKLTSNRRRWSHLFPAHHAEFLTRIHIGPNWKSLTSPAILPLTTDYYPSPKDLHVSYTESFYTLTLPSTSDTFTGMNMSTGNASLPRYRNHNELLVEMVCQRLASDFQLVATEAGTDVDVTRHRVPAGTTKRGPSGESRDSQSTIVYHLSMGHRIHELIYDEELQTIEVKRYKRASQSHHNEPLIYTYSLWVDQSKSFQPFQQRFYEYPQPEENWNSLDHLLCGYLDEMPDGTKCRRIRFALVPPLGISGRNSNESERDAYVQKFTKLLEYLQTRISSSDRKLTAAVKLPKPSSHVSTTGSGNTPKRLGPKRPHFLGYKICCSASSRVKMDTRNEWVMVMLEENLEFGRTYHFDVRWLACSGTVAEEFVMALKRKCKQAGLDMRRVPEYSAISFLHIHPLVAPIFLPCPNLEDSKRSFGTGASASACWYNSAMDLALVQQLSFVLDDERLADANGIGYGLGIGRDKKSVQSRSIPRFQRRSASTLGLVSSSGGSAACSTQVMTGMSHEARMLELWKKRGYRQYMHRHLPVYLRLLHDGIVWIPGYEYENENLHLAQRLQQAFTELNSLIQVMTTLFELTIKLEVQSLESRGPH